MAFTKKTLIAVLALLIVPVAVLAKTVKIEWDPEEGATKYELKIERDGQTAVSVAVDRPGWSGELENGLHAYQVRAVDAAGRAGAWSEPYPIVVMPQPPVLQSPAVSSTVEVLPDQEVLFEWAPVPGASHYQIEVRHNGEIVYAAKVTDHVLRLIELPEGDYTWSVRGVIIPGSQYPGFAGREWKTAASENFSFTLRKRTLSNPVLIYPIGEVWPSNDGRLEFKWEPVVGAAAYELRIHELLSAESDHKTPDRILRSETNSLVVNVGMRGRYTWFLRALGNAYSMDRGDAVKIDAKNISWPESHAEFHLQTSELSELPGTHLMLFSGYKFLHFDELNVGKNIQGTAFSDSLFLNLAIQKNLSREWAFAGELEVVGFELNNSMRSLTSASGALSYHLDLGFGWTSDIQGGLEFREMPLMFPTSAGQDTDLKKMSFSGATSEFAVSRFRGSKWREQFSVGIFYPLDFIPGGRPLSFVTDKTLFANSQIGYTLFHAETEKKTYIFGLQWESRKAELAVSSDSFSGQRATVDGFSVKAGLRYSLP